jgi:hypothetical protein
MVKVYVLMARERGAETSDLEGVFSTKEKAEDRKAHLKTLYIYTGAHFGIYMEELDEDRRS